MSQTPLSTTGSETSPGRIPVVLAFLAIYTIWGSTYLGIRIAVETLPPFLMAGVRFLLSGLLLYGWSRWRGAPRPTASQWRVATVIGALLLLGGNGAVVAIAHRLPSGLMALLVATTPFWMVGLEWSRKGGSRPSGGVFLGLAIGFVGMGLLLGPGNLSGPNGVDILGAVVLLGGTISWAVGSLLSRTARLPSSSFLAVGMEQIAGGLLLVLMGFGWGEAASFDPGTVSLESVLAFVYLLVFGSLVGFTSYIWLLKVSTPARVSTYAYVNPVIAVFLGWWIGGETLSERTLLAAIIIVSAVAAITTARDPGGRPLGQPPEEELPKDGLEAVLLESGELVSPEPVLEGE